LGHGDIGEKLKWIKKERYLAILFYCDKLSSSSLQPKGGR
jgi:hypothetical protein